MMFKLKDEFHNCLQARGPLIDFVKLFCLCFLVYFNEGVLFLNEQQQILWLKMLSYRVEGDVRTVGICIINGLCGRSKIKARSIVYLPFTYYFIIMLNT